MKQQGMLRRFARYYKPHKRLFIIDMCCAFVVSVINLVYPFITKEIINNYVPNRLLSMLLAGAGIVLGFFVIKAALNFVLLYWGHLVGVRIQADMRRELFVHLQTLPFSYYDNNKTGVIMSRMTNDLFQVSELAHHGPEDVFLSLITIVGAFILLATMDIYLALIVIGLVPFIALYAILMRKRMNRVYKRVRVAQGEVNADIESAISGMRVSRAFGASEHECQRFDSGNSVFVKNKGAQYRVIGEFNSSMTLMTDFLYFCALLAGGLFFYYGRINVGVFFAFVLYVTALINPIRTLTVIYDQIQEGASGFKRFCEIMDEPPESEAPDAVDPGRLTGHIVFDNVTFGYSSDDDNKQNVITDFSLDIAPGKTVALVGPSGGGKTTLCHLIPRFYEVDSGTITIDGHDIRTLKRSALRDNIAIVQQDVFLFNGTIRENIMYGDFSATDEQLVAAARRADIHEYIMSLPNGYDTEVGERGVKLSGGQKQRIAIARAFLKNPPILILDEATAALDTATEATVKRALDGLSAGRTTIVVAHRLTTVKNADEIVVITPDGVAERGTHSDLMKRDGLYKQLYTGAENG